MIMSNVNIDIKYPTLLKKIHSEINKRTIYEPTKIEKKLLLESDKRFWWLEYKGVDIYRTPAKELNPCGVCQLCNKYAGGLYTAHYSGLQIIPMCWKCWVDVDDL